MEKHIKQTMKEFDKEVKIWEKDTGYIMQASLYGAITDLIEKRERLLVKKIKKDVLRILDEELVTPLDINTIGKVPDDEWKVLSIKRLEKRIKKL